MINEKTNPRYSIKLDTSADKGIVAISKARQDKTLTDAFIESVIVGDATHKHEDGEECNC